MGKLDASVLGADYLAVKPPTTYPDLLAGGETGDGEKASALTAEAKIKAWHNSPEYSAFLARTRAAKTAQMEAQAKAELLEVEQILERARLRQASEAAAVTDVAELTTSQREQIGRTVTGTV